MDSLPRVKETFYIPVDFHRCPPMKPAMIAVGSLLIATGVVMGALLVANIGFAAAPYLVVSALMLGPILLSVGIRGTTEGQPTIETESSRPPTPEIVPSSPVSKAPTPPPVTPSRLPSPVFPTASLSPPSPLAAPLSSAAPRDTAGPLPLEDLLAAEDVFPKNLQAEESYWSQNLMPNEKVPILLKEHLAHMQKGLIVSTGTERSLFDLLLAPEGMCTGLVIRDTNPEVKAYIDFIVMLFRISCDFQDFQALQEQLNQIARADYYQGERDKVEQQFQQAIHRKLESSSVPATAKKYYAHNLRLLMEKWNPGYTNAIRRRQPYVLEGVDYFNDEALYLKLKKFAGRGAIVAMPGTMQDLQFLEQLRQPISVIDVSNINHYCLLHHYFRDQHIQPMTIHTDFSEESHNGKGEFPGTYVYHSFRYPSTGNRFTPEEQEELNSLVRLRAASLSNLNTTNSLVSRSMDDFVGQFFPKGGDSLEPKEWTGLDRTGTETRYRYEKKETLVRTTPDAEFDPFFMRKLLQELRKEVRKAAFDPTAQRIWFDKEHERRMGYYLTGADRERLIKLVTTNHKWTCEELQQTFGGTSPFIDRTRTALRAYRSEPESIRHGWNLHWKYFGYAILRNNELCQYVASDPAWREFFTESKEGFQCFAETFRDLKEGVSPIRPEDPYCSLDYYQLNFDNLEERKAERDKITQNRGKFIAAFGQEAWSCLCQKHGIEPPTA